MFKFSAAQFFVLFASTTTTMMTTAFISSPAYLLTYDSNPVYSRYPYCGDHLDLFDQRCCDQGQTLLDEDTRAWEKRGFDVDRQTWLEWDPPSTVDGTNVLGECVAVRAEIIIRYQKPCHDRKVSECCESDPRNLMDLSRCRIEQRSNRDGSVSTYCVNTLVTERRGRFGIIRKVQPRCRLPSM